MRAGVTVDNGVTKVDRAVLEVIGSNYELLRYGQTYSYRSKTRGIHVSDKESAYGVLGLTEYDVIKAVGTTDTFYRRGFREAIESHAPGTQMSISVVRLGEPTVLRSEIVTGLIADPAALKALAETWRSKAGSSDIFGSRGLGSGSGLGKGSGKGLGSLSSRYYSPPYVSWSKVRSLLQPVERSRKRRGEYKYDFAAKPLRALAADEGSLFKGARAMPSFRGDGIKIYGLFSSSPLTVLGFKSLDTIHSVNGKALVKSKDIAILREALRKRRTVVVSLTRRFQKHTLRLRIK
jgi:S1-C subfamily serine protease